MPQALTLSMPCDLAGATLGVHDNSFRKPRRATKRKSVERDARVRMTSRFEKEVEEAKRVYGDGERVAGNRLGDNKTVLEVMDVGDRSSVQVAITKNAIRRCNVKLLCPENGYPSQQPLHVELTSPTLPEDLVKKLNARLCHLAKGWTGEPQVLKLLDDVYRLIEENALVAAYDEIRDVKSMLLVTTTEGHGGDHVAASEKSGRITLTFKRKDPQRPEKLHAWKFRLELPPNYPLQPPTCSDITCSTVHRSLNAIMQHCLLSFFTRLTQQGEAALKAGTVGSADPDMPDAARSAAPVTSSSVTPIGRGPTTKDLHEIRRDIKVIKIAHDLNQRQDEKAMRRLKRTMNKTELQREKERQTDVEPLAVTRTSDPEAGPWTAEMLRQHMPRYVYQTADFVVNRLFAPLIDVGCVLCDKGIFDPPPTLATAKLTQYQLTNKEDRLGYKRMPCGHFFHTICLTDYVHQPPFDGKTCPVKGCGGPIVSKEWTVDFFRRKHTGWMKQQAQQRELDEIRDMFE